MMNITYGISEKIGCRSLMEDVHAIYQDADRKFFAAEIYDGHGGREAAEITSRSLKSLLKTDEVNANSCVRHT
jgi:serine/threonine protein phosphatase PrpC